MDLSQKQSSAPPRPVKASPPLSTGPVSGSGRGGSPLASVGKILNGLLGGGQRTAGAAAQPISGVSGAQQKSQQKSAPGSTQPLAPVLPSSQQVPSPRLPIQNGSSVVPVPSGQGQQQQIQGTAGSGGPG